MMSFRACGARSRSGSRGTRKKLAKLSEKAKNENTCLKRPKNFLKVFRLEEVHRIVFDAVYADFEVHMYTGGAIHTAGIAHP
jgi:hypothetical protein